MHNFIVIKFSKRLIYNISFLYKIFLHILPLYLIKISKMNCLNCVVNLFQNIGFANRKGIAYSILKSLKQRAFKQFQIMMDHTFVSFFENMS